MLHTSFAEKNELVDIYPGRKNAYRCTYVDASDEKYDIIIPKAECELLEYLKLLKSKLAAVQMVKLENLIEMYGVEMYEKGIDANLID